MNVFLDTESVGLVGPTKTVQYWVDGEPEPKIIYLPKGWLWNEVAVNQLYDLFRLIDRTDTTLYLYQAVHDLTHLYRLVHLLYAYDELDRTSIVPPLACQVIDLQIHAMQRSPLAPFAFSKGGARSVARVSKIPRACMAEVRRAVTLRIERLLPEQIRDNLKCSEHEVKGRPELVTLSWYVAGGLSLKGLMSFYGYPTLKLRELWPLPDGEKPYLPYTQPCHEEIEDQCDTILSDPTQPFHKYALLDPVFTRALWERLGKPTEPTDNDVCAHVVGYTRYAGFPLDRAVLERTERLYRGKIEKAAKMLEGVNLKSSKQRLELLRRYDPLIASSRKEVIAALAKSDRPSAPAAKAMLDFGMYSQRLDQVKKMLECKTGRMHPDLRVYGTATNRMAATGQFNVQGITGAHKITKKVKLPDGTEKEEVIDVLGIRAATEVEIGGDFSSLEVNVAGFAYGDVRLQEDMKSGLDLHMMTACLVSPLLRVERARFQQEHGEAWSDRMYAWAKPILEDQSHAEYGRVYKARKEHGKRVVFATLYGCAAPKIAEILGCTEEEGQAALDRFFSRYAQVGAWRRENERLVCTADTETWDEGSVRRMERSVQSLFGSVRHWDFEANVAETLWSLGQSGISLRTEGTVVRSEEKGAQTFGNAVRSACLGGAISVQAAVARQRANAPIQMSGSECCKALVSRIWRVCPIPLVVVHDEINCANVPWIDVAKIQTCTEEFLREYRKVIPTLNIDMKPMKHWSDK